jgi:hypothetical protein
VIIEALLPELIKPTAGVDTAQGQNILGPWLAPEHAGLFAARSDDGLATGLDNARTDKETPAAEAAILHAGYVVDDVTNCFSTASAWGLPAT